MPNDELFAQQEALTFDDLLIVPGYTEVLPAETDISARLTDEINLAVPLLSAAMDTVTSSAWPSRWPARAGWASSTATCRPRTRLPRSPRSNGHSPA